MAEVDQIFRLNLDNSGWWNEEDLGTLIEQRSIEQTIAPHVWRSSKCSASGHPPRNRGQPGGRNDVLFLRDESQTTSVEQTPHEHSDVDDREPSFCIGSGGFALASPRKPTPAPGTLAVNADVGCVRWVARGDVSTIPMVGVVHGRPGEHNSRIWGMLRFFGSDFGRSADFEGRDPVQWIGPATPKSAMQPKSEPEKQRIAPIQTSCADFGVKLRRIKLRALPPFIDTIGR